MIDWVLLNGLSRVNGFKGIRFRVRCWVRKGIASWVLGGGPRTKRLGLAEIVLVIWTIKVII